MKPLAYALVAATIGCDSSPPDEAPVDPLLLLFRELSDDAEARRIQIVASEIVDGPSDRPVLRRHGFRINAEYFYPASTVETCAAVAALQEIERRGPAITTDTPLVFHPRFDDEPSVDRADPTNLEGGAITVGHEIRKLAIVSDDRAFNRLYDLVGHAEINRRMWAAGLSSVAIHHRLSQRRTAEESRMTPYIELIGPSGVLTIPARTSRLSIPALDESAVAGLRVGHSFMGAEGRVEEPMDFRTKNRITILDLQDLLCMLVRPDVDLGKPGFELTDPHRAFLVEAMRLSPGASENPTFDAEAYPAVTYKPLLPGLARAVPLNGLDVYSKIGAAYGFTTDNAYVVERATGRAFFVTATIYTNPNGVLNDDDDEYDAVADPFFADLGEVLARHFFAS